jgi:hypothetical protein
MLPIVSLTPSIAALAIPPCSIATGRISSKLGPLAERFYKERIWLQVLKIFREEINKFWELLRARGVT